MYMAKLGSYAYNDKAIQKDSHANNWIVDMLGKLQPDDFFCYYLNVL